MTASVSNQQQQQQQEQQPIIIGAITDGNSDPRTIDMFRPYFDFVVNAEGVGVSKPNRRVYVTAIQQVAQLASVRDIFDDNSESSSSMTDDMISDLIGPWWVHIGDDFMKDVVAGKYMGMRTIWAKELVQDDDDKKEEAAPAAPQKP